MLHPSLSRPVFRCFIWVPRLLFETISSLLANSFVYQVHRTSELGFYHAMRSALVLLLGALLSQTLLGAFASVICDMKRDPGFNTTNTFVPNIGFLAHEIGLCIEDVCATRDSQGSITEHCQQVTLTVTVSIPPFLMLSNASLNSRVLLTNVLL